MLKPETAQAISLFIDTLIHEEGIPTLLAAVDARINRFAEGMRKEAEEFGLDEGREHFVKEADRMAELAKSIRKLTIKYNEEVKENMPPKGTLVKVLLELYSQMKKEDK